MKRCRSRRCAIRVRDAAGAPAAGLDSALASTAGRQFEKGKKSIALGLNLQDTSRTLTDSEADAIVAQVVDQLSRSSSNAAIRDK